MIQAAFISGLRRRRMVGGGGAGGGGGGSDAFAVEGFSPDLVASFTTQSDNSTEGEYFRSAGSDTTFGSLFTFARTGSAWYFNSSGVLTEATSGNARRDAYYYNGTAWVKGGLRLEGAAATNQAHHSNDFSQWNNNTNVSVTASASNGPLGASTMSKVEASGGSAKHHLRDYLSIATGNNTFAYWVKSAGEGVHPQIRATGEGSGFAFVNFDIDNGTVGNSNGSNFVDSGIIDYGGGVYLIYGVINHTSSGDGVQLAMCETPATDGELPIFSNDGAGFFVSGAQVEAGAIPTSHIPTNGSTVTRAAETLTRNAAASAFGATELSYAWDVLLTYDGNGPLFFDTTKTSNEYVRLYVRNGASTYHQFYGDGGAPDYTTTITAAQGGAVSDGVNQTFAGAYGIKASDEAQLVVNGNAGTAVSTTTIEDHSGQDMTALKTEGSIFIRLYREWNTKLPEAALVSAGTAA